MTGGEGNQDKLTNLFQRATVFLTDGIMRTFTMQLNGQTIEADREKAYFHLEDLETSLDLFLPKDEGERKVCFERSLPQGFMKFLGITDPSALSVLGTIFRESDITVVQKILDEVGIADVTTADCHNPGNESHNQRQQDKVEGKRRGHHDADERKDHSLLEGAQNYNRLPEQRRLDSTGISHTSNPATPSKRMRVDLDPPTPEKDQKASYAEIIRNAVMAAKNKAAQNPPSSGGSSDVLRHHLSEVARDVRQCAFGSPPDPNRSNRIGAAGELYVRSYSS